MAYGLPVYGEDAQTTTDKYNNSIETVKQTAEAAKAAADANVSSIQTTAQTADQALETAEAVRAFVEAPTDDRIATLVADNASSTGAALNAAIDDGIETSPYLPATYSRIGPPMGSQAAILGDSLANFGEGVVYYASVLSRQQINVRGTSYVVSYPGETSATIKTHVSDITGLDPAPDFCLVSAGSNDASTPRPLADYRADMIAVYDALRAAGIAPVVCTVPPRTNRGETIRVYNAWLRDYARRNRLALAEWFGAVVDPANGNYLAAMDNGDNVHPNAAGVESMAKATIDALSALLPPAQTLTAQSSGGWNLQPNSSFTLDSNADGLADFLSASTTTGFSVSRVADPAGFQWQRITLSGQSTTRKVLGRALTNGGVTTTLAAAASAGATTISTNASLPNGTYIIRSASSGEVSVVAVTGSSGSGPYTVTLAGTLAVAVSHAAGDVIMPCFEIGDRLLIAARVRSGQSGTNTKHTLQATFYRAGQASVVQNRILTSPASGMSRKIDNGVVYAELVAPAESAVLQLDFTAGPGDGTYDFAQPTIYNLTKMGL